MGALAGWVVARLRSGRRASAFQEDPMAKQLQDSLAPDFTLPDYEGRPVSLSDFRGRKHVVLVFNRGFM